MNPTGVVSVAASLGQFVEWAHNAHSNRHKDQPAITAWQGVVESAATDAVHQHAQHLPDAQQQDLFERLLQLVGSGDRAAWTILGNPHLTVEDLEDLPADVRDLCLTFSTKLHAGLALEAARPRSPLTNAAVIGRLGHLGAAVENLGDVLGSVKERVDYVANAVTESGTRARDEAAAVPPDLAALPPNVQESLERARTSDPEGAHRLGRHLTAGNSPEDTIAALVGADAAEWWKAVGGLTVLAAARHAAAHGLHPQASALYERAADLEGVNRPRCFALAAYHVADTDRPAADRLLERARIASPQDQLVMTISDLLGGDHGAILVQLGDQLRVEDDDWVFLVGIQRWALETADRPSDAIALARAAIAEAPNNSSMHLHLARLLRERAETNSATRDADLNDALTAAIAARELRRRWSGPSNEAVIEACQICAVTEDWDTVIDLGLRPPEGEATAVETADPFVIAQVAAAAALGRRVDIASTLLPRLAAGFHRSLLEGWTAEADGDTTAAVAALSAAADAAGTDAELSWALRGLAGLGHWPIPQLDQLAKTSPDEATLVTAISEIHRNLPDDAIARLTPLRRESAHIPVILAQAHEIAGRPDAAVDELRSGFAATGDATMLLCACHILVRAGQAEEAEDLGTEAMSAIPSGRPVRHQTRRLLIELAARRGDDRRVETLASTAIAEGDPGEGIRWHLAHALHRRNENDRAWDVLQGPPALVPGTEDGARLWLNIHARTGRDRATVQQMLDVVAHFEDSEQVQGIALGLFFLHRGDRSVSDSEGSAIRALASTFVQRWPESKLLSSYKVNTDDPVALARQVNEIARLGQGRRQKVLEAIEMYATATVPFGVVASVAGLSITEALLDRLGGHIVTSFNELGDEGADAAAAAVGEVVSIDLPAAYLASIDEATWAQTTGAFRRLIVADGVVGDAAAAGSALGLDRGGHLGYDDRTDRAIVAPPDKERDRANEERAAALRNRLANLDAVSCSRVPLLPDFDDGHALNWAGPLQVASDQGVALFSDDQTLRSVARSLGVPSFGTLDLIDAMLAAGRIAPDDAATWRDTLHRLHATDVYTDTAALLGSAAPLDTSVSALSRLWPWTTPGAVEEILRSADRAGADPAAIASYWFAVGACRYNKATASKLVQRRIAVLVGDLRVGGSAAWAISAMRDACLDRGVEDPLPGAAVDVRDALATQVGSDEATRLTIEMLSGLGTDAHQLILRALALT